MFQAQYCLRQGKLHLGIVQRREEPVDALLCGLYVVGHGFVKFANRESVYLVFELFDVAVMGYGIVRWTYQFHFAVQ